MQFSHNITYKRDFAILNVCGKQFKVFPGAVLQLDRLPHAVGENITFSEILIARLGENILPLSRCFVNAIVIDHIKGKKVRIIKFKRRKHSLKRMGFRASLTRVKILNIQENI
jgi:large subunit ribosomal protein L21